jgi:hypothetical protein
VWKKRAQDRERQRRFREKKEKKLKESTARLAVLEEEVRALERENDAWRGGKGVRNKGGDDLVTNRDHWKSQGRDVDILESQVRQLGYGYR